MREQGYESAKSSTKEDKKKKSAGFFEIEVRNHCPFWEIKI